MYTLFQFVPALVIGTVFMGYERSMVWQTRAGVAGLVIMTLVCVGGIFELKRWAFLLEALRQPVMAMAAFIWASITFGLDSSAGVIAAGAGTIYSMCMLVWLLQYRYAFTRAFGPVEFSPDTVTPVEPERLPDIESARELANATK